MVVGIDPGFSGAIAMLYNKNMLIVKDLPLKMFMGRPQIDGYEFSRIIEMYKSEIEFAVIEDVNAMPNQGVVSMFRFGYNAGILLGVLDACRVEVLKVKPAVWKSALNLSSDKKKSLALAKKTFPKYKNYFTRVKDDGRAEAALLAFFAYKTFL